MAGASDGDSGAPLTLAEAVEEYTSHHPETVEEVLHWTSTKFDRLFELHQKRILLKGLDEQKNTMVGALWSNSNWDDTKEVKGHRQRMIQSIEEQHKEAVEIIEKALGVGEVPEDDKIDKDNPFFAASERGLKKIDQVIEKRGIKVDKDADKIDYMQDLDQG